MDAFCQDDLSFSYTLYHTENNNDDTQLSHLQPMNELQVVADHFGCVNKIVSNDLQKLLNYFQSRQHAGPEATAQRERERHHAMVARELLASYAVGHGWRELEHGAS